MTPGTEDTCADTPEQIAAHSALQAALREAVGIYAVAAGVPLSYAAAIASNSLTLLAVAIAHVEAGAAVEAREGVSIN